MSRNWKQLKLSQIVLILCFQIITWRIEFVFKSVLITSSHGIVWHIAITYFSSICIHMIENILLCYRKSLLIFVLHHQIQKEASYARLLIFLQENSYQAQTQPKTVLKDTRQHLDGFFENNLYTTKHRKLTSKSKMALKRINKVSR